MLKRRLPPQRLARAILATLCLAILLAWEIAAPAHAQDPGVVGNPNSMLVVLKNQPAREGIASLLSPSTSARQMAEAELHLAHQNAAEAFQLDVELRLKSAVIEQTKEAASRIQEVAGPEQDLIAARL